MKVTPAYAVLHLRLHDYRDGQITQKRFANTCRWFTAMYKAAFPHL